MSFLIKFFKIVKETHLLYFFSALAQCAASFAALVGVFAIFRLQSNAARINEEYIYAKYWLMRDVGITQAEFLTSQEIKKRLTDHYANPQIQISAKEVLGRILAAEEFNKKLVYKVSKPLKYWVVIFIGSMTALPFAKWLEGFVGAIVVFISVFASSIALWKTRRFVQRCLDFK